MHTMRFITFGVLLIGAGALTLNTRRASATENVNPLDWFGLGGHAVEPQPASRGSQDSLKGRPEQKPKKPRPEQKPNPEMMKVKDKTVVLLMFDSTYLNLFECWAEHYAKEASHSLKNLHIVALDEKARDHATRVLKDKKVGFSMQFIAPPNKTKSFAHVDHTAAEGLEGSSGMYQAYFWKVIGERLAEGNHVLHMDLDAIPVDDPWKAFAESDAAADMIAPNNGRDFQFLLFKSTPAVREVVDYFAEFWKNWPAKGGPPGGAEQFAFTRYMEKYGQCAKKGEVHCKTHTGKTLLMGNVKGVTTRSVCDYPAGCHAKGMYVVHGRHILSQMCPNSKDLTKIENHN